MFEIMMKHFRGKFDNVRGYKIFHKYWSYGSQKNKKKICSSLLSIGRRNREKEKDLLRSIPTPKASALALAERKVNKKEVKNDSLVSNFGGQWVVLSPTKFRGKTRLGWEKENKHMLYLGYLWIKNFMRFEFHL